MEMIRLEFIIKFMADSLSDSMVFPRELANNSKEMAKLDKNIYLVGPSGSRWEVILIKRGGDFYLKDGWKEFIQDQYVMDDDRLIFKYCGNSCFTVHIFDKSGCERESCYFVKNGRNAAPKKLLQGQQKYVSQSSEDKECSTQLSSDQSLKTPEDKKDCINLYASRLRSCLKTNAKKAEMKISSSKAEDYALRLVKAISKRNPCFFKVLPPSSISWSGLLIPHDFVVNCKLYKQQLTTLKIPRKREWVVRYFRRGSSWFLLWRSFAQDNSLKGGDACVFELTEYCPKMIMVVYIFRAP